MKSQILKATACVIVSMVLYPPWKALGMYGLYTSMGWALIGTYPKYAWSGAGPFSAVVIDIPLLLTEIFVALLIGGICAAVAPDETPNRNPPAVHPRSKPETHTEMDEYRLPED